MASVDEQLLLMKSTGETYDTAVIVNLYTHTHYK